MITVTLFGTPRIYMNDTLVHFPFQKAEALFLYLCVEKKVSRQQAIRLLWSDQEDAAGKKNLRNALYSVKSTIDAEILLTDNSDISLNPAAEIACDYYGFQDGDFSLELYSTGFMHGYYVKNAIAFEDWLRELQTETQARYLNLLFDALQSTDPDDIPQIEKLYNLYIGIAPLDERAYFFMMNAYMQNHLYYKGITVYQRLSALLNSELAITPGKKTTKLYYRLLDEWSNTSSTLDLDQEMIHGHDNIINLLNHAYEQFPGQEANCIMLVGEYGIGKSFLANHFIQELDLSDRIYLYDNCKGNRRLSFEGPWIPILEQLIEEIHRRDINVFPSYLNTVTNFLKNSRDYIDTETADLETMSYMNDFKYITFRNHFNRLITQVSRTTPIILYLDDVNNCDAISLDLLSYLIRVKNPNLFILTTCLDIVSYDVTTFISTLAKDHLLKQIKVEPLPPDSFSDFIHNVCEIDLDEQTIADIYRENNGNTFFIKEYVNNLRYADNKSELSYDSTNILNDSIENLSPDAGKLLNLLSVFDDPITLPVLINVMNKTAGAILYLLEELKDHGIIIELIRADEICFDFRHYKMKQHVYNLLPKEKRNALKKHVAMAQKSTTADTLIKHQDEIINHYTQAGNANKLHYYRNLIHD